MNPTTISDRHFTSILRRHNLEATITDKGITIQKNKQKNHDLQYYLMGGVLVSFAGLLLFLFLSIRIGLLVMMGGGGLIAVYLNLRQREKDAERKTVTVNHRIIAVKEGFKGRTVNTEEVTELRTKVNNQHSMNTGTITAITERGMAYELLELYGIDEVDLRQDLVQIAGFLAERYLNE
jgi:hypothetical protein